MQIRNPDIRFRGSGTCPSLSRNAKVHHSIHLNRCCSCLLFVFLVKIPSLQFKFDEDFIPQ